MQCYHHTVKCTMHNHFRRSESQSHHDTGCQLCPQRPALQCPPYIQVLKYTCGIAGFQLLWGNR